MNSLFAAGLFDSPWLLAVLIIVGALASWLSKRRQEKGADARREGDEPSPGSGEPPGELSLEEALRRLMGEEPPVPPPIPRGGRGGLPPAPDWQEEEPFQPARRTVPPLPPPLIPVAQAGISPAVAGEQQEESVRRLEQLNAQGRHPATVVGHGRGYRSGVRSRRAASRWRDPRSARRAFVASLVFGTPKGLEP